MYKIRKFINHIYETPKIGSGYLCIIISVFKHKYIVDTRLKNVKIQTSTLQYINVSDHVTKHKKKYYYTYEPNMIKMWVNHSDKMVMIIDNCILIIRYDDDSHPINYIVINMKGEAFIFQN